MTVAIRASSPDDRADASARLRWLVAIVCTAAFGWTLWRTAWMCDDAYITLRTIDNFVNGYGLRWNVAERVQSYTHPAWLILVTPLYALTREPYLTTLAIQIALAIGTMFVLTRYAAVTAGRAAVVGAVFLSSRALTDFSTSGLENPLTHAALVGVFFAFRRTLQGRPALAWLGACASVAILCRQDLVLLIAPALLYAWLHTPRPRIAALAIGLAPAAIWHLGSLIYYGALVPNTALAKLATGVPSGDLIEQGWNYWRATFLIDPVTVLAIVLGCMVIVARRGRAGRVIAGGVVLYSLFLLRAGGDFMSGRFLTPVLFWTLVGYAGLPAGSSVATAAEPVRVTLRHCALSVLIVVAGLFVTDTPPLLSPASFGTDTREEMVEHFGVADERRFYYPALGLQRQFGVGGAPAANPWADMGRAVRSRPQVPDQGSTPGLITRAGNCRQERRAVRLLRWTGCARHRSARPLRSLAGPVAFAQPMANRALRASCSAGLPGRMARRGQRHRRSAPARVPTRASAW